MKIQIAVLIALFAYGLAVAQQANEKFNVDDVDPEDNVNSEDNLLRQILRDVSLVKNATEVLGKAIQDNTQSINDEKGMCKRAMLKQTETIEERVSSRTHNKIAESLVEYEQIFHEYSPCEVGNVFKKLKEYMAGEVTCVGRLFKKNELKVTVTFTNGKPEVGLECDSADCYSCMADQGCNLDTLLAAITNQRISKQGILTPARNYIGNHQLRFDGANQYVQLPRFYAYESDITFEAWVAWEPDYTFNRRGATARIFDFFSEKDSRGLNRGEGAVSKEEAEKTVTVATGDHGEKSRVIDEKVAPGMGDLLLTKEGVSSVEVEDTEERADRGIRHDEEEQGDYTLKFRPRYETSNQWVSSFTLSPGEYLPANETDAQHQPSVGVRFVVDNVEIVGPKPLVQNRWTHVAVSITNHGADKSRDCCWRIRVYVDGELVVDRRSIPLSQIRPDRILYVVDKNFLGRNQDGSPEGMFKGYIDEFRIWRSCRSQEQINSYMHRPIPASDENLVAYYRFDELLHHDTVVDETVNRHDGSLGDKVSFETQPVRVSMRSENLPYMGA